MVEGVRRHKRQSALPALSTLSTLSTISAHPALPRASARLCGIVFLLVEHGMASRCVLQCHVMAFGDIGLQAAIADVLQHGWHELMHVCLPQAKAQTLVKVVSEQPTMDKPGMHARHADAAAAPGDRNALAQPESVASLSSSHLPGSVAADVGPAPFHCGQSATP